MWHAGRVTTQTELLWNQGESKATADTSLPPLESWLASRQGFAILLRGQLAVRSVHHDARTHHLGTSSCMSTTRSLYQMSAMGGQGAGTSGELLWKAAIGNPCVPDTHHARHRSYVHLISWLSNLRA